MEHRARCRQRGAAFAPLTTAVARFCLVGNSRICIDGARQLLDGLLLLRMGLLALLRAPLLLLL